MKHDSLDQATQGFMDALTEELEKAGKTVDFDTQVAGTAELCALGHFCAAICTFHGFDLLYK